MCDCKEKQKAISSISSNSQISESQVDTNLHKYLQHILFPKYLQ